jgi:hypothetical protein
LQKRECSNNLKYNGSWLSNGGSQHLPWSAFAFKPPSLQQQHHHLHKDSKTFTNSQYICRLQLQEIEFMQPALPHHHCKTIVDCFDHAAQSQSELCFFKP